VKHRFLTALLSAFAGHAFAAVPEFSDVFTAGQDGYKSIRIPSVVVTRKGSVFAFAEGRERPTDQAENDIVLKRSTDGGRTWGALQVVHEDGKNSLNNPTVVVEQQNGRVFLMYQRIPAHLNERSNSTDTGYEGTNIYRNLLVWSDDDGATWTKPLDVTRTTKRATNATTIASGPGIGIQLTRGPHAGRLIIPFNEGPCSHWNNFAVFSDDRGATWGFGENVPGAFVKDAELGQRSQINEVRMVELTDGSVRLSSRQFAGAKVRKTSVSSDGGVTWSPVADAPELRDPSCNASALRYSFADCVSGLGPILYSGPDAMTRSNGTVYLSRDDGATWPVKRALLPGSFAYSVLTKLPDGSVGCLFETDNYGRIVFARFSICWVEATE
jgi:sialidase-1